MSSPRLRRLTLDHERLRSRFHQWAPIEITPLAGDPPEQYRVVYRIRGLHATPEGRILERGEHVVEVNLSLGYPRRAPQCKMLTPIFHPNFDEVSVCIGDFWAASEGLDDLVVRIGRMIAFQEYNVKSPLNGLAAKWAAQNTNLLPVDNTELAPPLDRPEPEPVDKIVLRLGMPEGADARFAPPTAVLPDPVAETVAESAPVGAASPLEFVRLEFGTIAVGITPGKTLTIGSLPGNDVQILHSNVSGYHAELVFDESGLRLRDLGSTKGTTKNSLPIVETFVRPGDHICFGSMEARLLGGL